ncbi:MAG: tail fiber domain-containing protein [Lewinellaceae bacterium]|nr:tail fiber domain-containing protein [Lewinellaceae bacterium]
MKPNKFHLTFTLALALVLQLAAQTDNVGIGTTTPDPSAALDVQSTDKGVLIPRMTTAQREAIASPATGLKVYDTDEKSFFYWDGTRWFRLGLPTDGGIHGVLKSDAEGNAFWEPLIDSTLIPSYSPSGANPFLVGAQQLRYVDVNGNYAYIGLGGGTDRFKVVDVSQPDNLMVTGSLNTGSSSIISRIIAMGDLAYVCDLGESKLDIISVSDPFNPSPVGTIGLYYPQTFALQGEFAYVLDLDGFKVIDVSNPAAPSLTSTLAFATELSWIAIQGDYAYVVELIDGNIHVIDISNKAAPAIVGSLLLGGEMTCIEVLGDYAYVIVDDPGELKVVNISNPATPILSASLTGLPYLWRALKISGHFVFLGTENDIRIIDVQDQNSPVAVDVFGTGYNIYSIDVQENYAYSAKSAENRLDVIKLFDPIAVGVGPSGTFALSVNDKDTDPTNEIQTIDVFNLNGTNLEISLGKDDETTHVLDLSSLSPWTENGNDIFNSNDGNVGIGTLTPDPSAVLDIDATDRGLLIPRMTTFQRNAIANPVAGLIIYNTTDSCFNYYTGEAWYKDCGRSLTDYTFSGQGGSTGLDRGQDVATDATGNVFVTGYFEGTATFGTISLTSAGDKDVFLIKIDPTGNVLWAKQGGGTGNDQGFGIATDATGNVIITGAFQDVATFGSTSLNTSPAGSDLFYVKYDTDGNIIWAKEGNNSIYGSVVGNDIVVDASENIFVTGTFVGNFDFGAGSLSSIGDYDGFIAKYDAAGNVQWVKQIGGTDTESISGIATDLGGNIYITGEFTGTTNFDGTSLTSVGGTRDVFTAMCDGTGTLQWVAQGGGTSFDSGRDVSVDASGNVYATGYFNTEITFGSTVLNVAGTNFFVVKYDPAGNVLWVKNSASSTSTFGYGITVDASGDVLATGQYLISATFGTTTLTSSGMRDVFILKYDGNGNLLWAKSGGGTQNDEGLRITTDLTGIVYVTGYFQDVATFENLTLTSGGSEDMFTVQYSSLGTEVLPDNGLSTSEDNDIDDTNELITSIALNGNNLEITDAGGTATLDLSSIDTDTDDQTIDVLYLNGTTLEISLEDDGQPTQTLDLGSIDTDTDDQTIDVLNLIGTTLEISLEGDGQPTQTLDLSSIDTDTDTDDQTIDVLNLNGTNLEISLEGDGQPTQVLDLSSLMSSSQWSVNGIDIINNNSGNVGIGTPTPAALLHVSGTSRFDGIINTNNQWISGDGDPEGVSIDDNSNVGIGTSTPNQKLEVFDGNINLKVGNNADDQGILFQNLGSSYTWNIFRTDAGSNKADLVIAGGGTAANPSLLPERFRIADNGNIGIGTASPSEKLHVVGNICATGTIATCSDVRFKKDFQPIAGALGKIQQLNGLYYYWKKEEFPDRKFNDERQIGLIAQEVEALFPEMVLTDNEGYKSLDYSRLTPVLVEAVKEQQKIIENGELRMDNIEQQNSMLSAEVESLKNQLTEMDSLKNRLEKIEAVLTATSQK